MWETWVSWEDPLEEGMATQSNVLAWRIPTDRGTWWSAVHGAVRSSDMTEQLSAYSATRLAEWGDLVVKAYLFL